MTQSELIAPQGSIDPSVVRQYCDAMHRWAGVTIDPAKTYLLRQRLQPIMQAASIESYADLLTAALRDKRLELEIVDALTTHETLFFRDRATLDAIADRLIPAAGMNENPARSFDIWCAGCSSGQEPYSLAILLEQRLDQSVQSRIRTVATDVSAKIVAKAKRGWYDAHEVRRGISEGDRQQYFREVDGGLEIEPRLKSRIDFRTASLTDPKSPPGPYDVILCRNVLIYFQPDDVQRIVASLIARLKPGGTLLLGSTEIVPTTAGVFQRKSIHGVFAYVADSNDAHQV